MADSPVTPEDLSYLIDLMKDKKISGTIAKNVIDQIFENKGSAKTIIESQGLMQINDSNEVVKFVEQAISENPKIVEDTKKNPNAIKFLVGQVMKLSKGKVNPKIAEEELTKKLGL
jgi:aspartyl-tRNA(Asn)/glutamyl-tRNA(Gln) amidotransferase subunit B